MIRTAAHRRVALSFLDQCVSSGSNFLTGAMVARLSGAAEFGNYVLALMAWLIAVGLHRALVTEPVIITSSRVDDHGQRRLIARGVSADLMLGAFISAVVAIVGVVSAAAGLSIGRLCLALAPWFIPLLVQDYWRAMAFQRRRPDLALVNDLFFAGVQLAAVALALALGWRSAPFMIAAWGAGATAGAALGFWWFPAPSGATEGRRLVAHLWPLSRWMLADFLTGFASQQAYLASVAFLLPRIEYGGFRAATSLMGPAVVIVHATANLGLPEASRLAGAREVADLRRFARRVSAGTSLCLAAYGGLVVVGGGYALGAVYGTEFSPFAPLATLAALEGVMIVSVFGQVLALKATARTRVLWAARLVVAAASLASALVLVPWLGTIGAGWAGVATAAFYVTAIYLAHRSELRRPYPLEGTELGGPASASTSFLPHHEAPEKGA